MDKHHGVLGKYQMYLACFDPAKQYTSNELRALAITVKADIKRAEDLRRWLRPYYHERDYPMQSIKDYLDRASNTQYAISRNL